MDDIRIGIASNMDTLNEEFAYSEQGHNYSFIVYAEKACAGYNGQFEAIESDQSMAYQCGDVMTVELDMRDRVLTFYKNKKLVHRRSDIKETSYRMAVSLYGQSASMKITSFQCIFLGNTVTEDMWTDLGYGAKEPDELRADHQDMIGMNEIHHPIIYDESSYFW